MVEGPPDVDGVGYDGAAIGGHAALGVRGHVWDGCCGAVWDWGGEGGGKEDGGCEEEVFEIVHLVFVGFMELLLRLLFGEVVGVLKRMKSCCLKDMR